jgi:hypothetical protein
VFYFGLSLMVVLLNKPTAIGSAEPGIEARHIVRRRPSCLNG